MIWRHLACDHPEKGGLSGPVVPDDAKLRTLRDGEGQVFEKLFPSQHKGDAAAAYQAVTPPEVVMALKDTPVIFLERVESRSIDKHRAVGIAGYIRRCAADHHLLDTAAALESDDDEVEPVTFSGLDYHLCCVSLSEKDRMLVMGEIGVLFFSLPDQVLDLLCCALPGLFGDVRMDPGSVPLPCVWIRKNVKERDLRIKAERK